MVREATDDYPEGLVHYGLSDTEAAASYEKSVFEDPTREAGIWRDLDSGEHVAVQGGEDFVTAKWMNDAEFAGKRWHLVEHFQPTSASKLERYASVEDYDALMKPYWGRNPPVEPPGPISSTIRWHDARTGKPRYTTFGYNPAAEEPFWIEFLDLLLNRCEGSTSTLSCTRAWVRITARSLMRRQRKPAFPLTGQIIVIRESLLIGQTSMCSDHLWETLLRQ